MHAIAITALLLVTQTLPGESTKAVHVVPLVTTKPEICLSVPAGQGVSVVLDKAEVAEMARPRPVKWNTEAERMKLVRSVQAQSIMKGITERNDLLGCKVVELRGDGIYALLEVMNRGHGRVWDMTSGSFLPTVERIEYNIDCSQGLFGTYAFRKPGGEEFIFIQACIV
jgi:hypothetical protein